MVQLVIQDTNGNLLVTATGTVYVPRINEEVEIGAYTYTVQRVIHTPQTGTGWLTRLTCSRNK